MSSKDLRAADSDGNSSLTPSEQSDNDEHTDHDSDYESDDGEDRRLDSKGKSLNVQWTGYAKRVPVILFSAETILNKRTDLKTVGERYHLAFKFASTECKIVRNILVSHGFHEVHPNSADYNLIWSNSHLKPFTLRTMSEFQKINHFPRSYELTRKDRLFKNVQRMQQIKGHKHFDFIPASFVLPGDYQDFCSNFLKDKGPYIVKPVASSRGRGVFLVNHPDQVPLDENLIVCKYISSPLVIDGFKFDLRIYVAVTSYDPLVIYLYEEGLTRFATVKYEKHSKHIRNQCMHLTNYSVNKRSNDYVKNDDPDVEDYGNKWSMGALLRYLRSEGKDTAALMMRIEDVVIKTILSVESSVATACKMFQPYKGNCFELYGFDVLLDETLKPWVLEVNLSPSLACDSPLDLKIKSNMLCDLFSLAGVVCHDPMMRTMQPSKRNLEVTAKLGNRAKSAPLRPTSAKPGTKEDDSDLPDLLAQIEEARLKMKKLDHWLLRKGLRVSLPVKKSPRIGLTRPQSATTSASKERQTNKGMVGLNSEEIKIVRRVKEEDTRKGGWIRIFPTSDSWDTHGSFLQFHTTHNLMLHQRLYPERHKTMMTSKMPGTSVITPSKSKNNIHLQVTGSGKAEQERFIESYTQALLRAKQYERRLGRNLGGKSRRKKRSRSIQKRNKLVQGIAETEDQDGEAGSDDEATVNERGKEKKEQEAKSEENAKAKVETVGDESGDKETNDVKSKASAIDADNDVDKDDKNAGRKENVKNEAGDNKGDGYDNSDGISLPSPPLEPKYDVIGLLEKGYTLSKVQARTAFAMYLIRVQQRLLSDCGGVLKQEDIDALNEQMDLVLRFLKRAAMNLPQAFRVVVPSKKLPLSDRRRILAKQLGDFVHIYNKETDHLKAIKVRVKLDNRKMRKSEGEGLDENKFDQFVYTAAEGELEEVLTTYTKINKSAAIFLGGDSKPGVQALSEAKREILSRRRENPDITDGTVPVGTTEDGNRLRHEMTFTYNNNAMGISETGLPVSRPSSAYGGSTQSYSTAVSIYSQRLSRPRSASSSGGGGRSGRMLMTRPASASSNRPNNTNFVTSDPIVDTYNEKAIQEALQRLALKQQARQYSAVNGTSLLKPETSTTTLPMRPLSGIRPGSSGGRDLYTQGMSITGQSQTLHSHVGPGYSRSSTQLAGPRYVTMEEHLARASTNRPPVASHSHTNNVHSQNANATFNSFIEDPNPQWQSEIATAYNEVTGVAPQNYHMTSVNSRQYQLAHQQSLKQRMMEQSKVMLEQSKAKHNAMVSQAQNNHQQLHQQPHQPTVLIPSHTTDVSISVYDPTQPEIKQFTPKPPIQPSHKRVPSAHRATRKPTDEINFNFYTNAVDGSRS